MRIALLAFPMSLLAGCSSGANGNTGATDLGAPAADLLPTCLEVEPEDPATDPDCPIVKPAEKDALDDALASAGLDRCTLTVGTGGFARDPYRLPWYDRVHDYAVNGPAFARTLTTRLDQAASSPTPVARQLLLLGNRLATARIAACVPAFEIDPQHPLARALARLITDAGGTADAAALEAASKDLPLALQVALAQVVYALGGASADWKALTADLSTDDLYVLAATSGLILPGAGGGAPDLTQATVRTLLSKTFDEAALVAGGARLAAAVEDAHLARFAGMTGFALDVKTPLGRVVVRGAADDTYEDDAEDAIALLVDTGGNDLYRKAIGAVGGGQVVGSDPGEPIRVAVAIDLGGDDTYGYAEEPDPLDTARDKAMAGVTRLPSDLWGRHRRGGALDYGPISLSDAVRQGGARLGYGMLFDLGDGDDRYRSLRMSQGFGCAGVGVLFDAGGNDLYEGEAGVQGAAVFGVGLLLDAGGNDTYRTYADSQGFAYVRAVGALYDGAGSDKYLADSGIPALGGDPIFISPQTPCDRPGAACGNSSFTQGVGFGRRAPGGGDSAFMAGGLGVLRDLAGDDVYLTSVFGQASGYWLGTGILSDGGGNDRYDGWWYTQGSAAHGALCMFEDGAGDDRYDVSYPMNPPYATNTGQGHDLSVGWHIDGGGQDVYRAPGLGLGGGNANGGGFFVNLGGDDRYETPGGTVLGGAKFDLDANRSPSLPCYGVFLDVGGKDTYMVPPDPRLQPPPGDDVAWKNPRDDPPFNDRTVGVDRASGKVLLP